MRENHSIDVYPLGQDMSRGRLFAAYRRKMEEYWDEGGNFIWRNPKGHGGYRGMLWACLTYLDGDEREVEWANRIIVQNYTERPCHFTPGAAAEVLYYHRDKLTAEAVGKLERYLSVNVPFMGTGDLQIHGYNDNHPYKAMHALVVGGEMLDMPYCVEKGLFRLRQALELLERNGFPCEYNSPNYTPVSLQPLASLAGQTRNEEARELAIRLERFYWRDLAWHFDARAGLPTGPMSRAGAADHDGQLGNTLCLMMHLFPVKYAIDLVEELLEKGAESKYVTPGNADLLPFYQAIQLWFARADYHLTPELAETLFSPKTGREVKGTVETGTWALNWQPEKRPAEAPKQHHTGPRRTMLTTYYGENYTLGTAQASFLDNGQTHGFYATLAPPLEDGEKVDPARSRCYFARCFFDERYPYAPNNPSTSYARDEGDIRTLQHENTAMVLYNPWPWQGNFQQIRTGVFRPLMHSRPRTLFVGETEVRNLNFIGEEVARVAIDEGDVYVGIVPLRLTDRGQARQAGLQVHTYGDHLSILISSLETWTPQDWSYEEIVETHTGFVFEVRAAAEFESFEHFRAWLGRAVVEDYYFAIMRTTTYQREGLQLSTCYSPFQGGFRHATVNGEVLEVVSFGVR